MTADLSLTAFPIVALRPMMDREQLKSVSNPDKSRTTRRGLKVRKKSRRIKAVDPSLTVFSNVDPSLMLDWERPSLFPIARYPGGERLERPMYFQESDRK